MCGLCGNFDGIQNNDLTSSSLQVEEDPVDFGNSWKVSPRCADTQKVGRGCGVDRGRWVLWPVVGAELGERASWSPSGLTLPGPSVYSCPVPQVPPDPSPATCHNNVMKQTMVDSSCSVLTSDIFQECNRLVRVAGPLGAGTSSCGCFQAPQKSSAAAPLSWLQAGAQKE